MKDKGAEDREGWLVLRAQSGDAEALNDLLKAVQAPLFRYISSLVGDAHLAENILQEVFIRIYRKLQWLREPAVFRSWAYQIASRESFRQLKRERRWSVLGDETVLYTLTAPPPREEFSHDLIEQLPQFIKSLSPASRAVIVLYYLHEMSLVETAAILGIPLGTVKSRLAYGLESLRKHVRQTIMA
jgi:RNA polymerase sigma-70 factor, ECF subfamily